MKKKVRNGICPECDAKHDRKHSVYCAPCHAAYMRAWRKTHPMTDEQRKKDNCRSYSNVLLKRGKLNREPCKNCGEKAQMHHPDYDNPRLVEWMCRPCHLQHHSVEHSNGEVE